jgi:hypothetical protein
MGVAIIYTYTGWTAIYPQFAATVTQAAFDAMLYPLAQQYCVNDGSGLVSTSITQTNLMGLMCSHIAQLLFGTATQPASGIVGRVNTATEGSVSVGAEMPAPNNAIQGWLNQTQFGAMYWAATAPYRTMRYLPGRSYRA